MRRVSRALEKSRRPTRPGLSVAIALWALAAAFWQDGGPPLAPRRAQPLVRISVDVVRLDVVVTDKQGKRVTGLRAEDFEVFQNGKRQAIQTLGYVSGTELSATERPSSRLPGPIPSYSLRPEKVDRSLAFIIDEFSLSPSSMKAVQDTLAGFVDEKMQPGDLVTIVRTHSGVGVTQQFTTDKRRLAAAVRQIAWKGLDRRESFALGELGWSNSSYATLNAVRYVVNGLEALPSRKFLVLFTERLIGERDLLGEELHKIVDAANRAAAVIYTVDPGGLSGGSPFSIRDDRSGELGSGEPRRGPVGDRPFESKEAVDYLADQTGGFSIRHTNDVPAALDHVLQDQQGYYLIGYSLAAQTKPGDFQKVEIRVKRPELRVRTRKGFYLEAEASQPAVSRSRQLAEAIVSPFAADTVPVQLTSLFRRDKKEGALVESFLHIDPRGLRMTKHPDGAYWGLLDVLAVTYDANGQPIDTLDGTHTYSMNEEIYQAALQRGLIHRFLLKSPKPGACQLRVAVRDGVTQGIGSANQFVEVPDLKKDRLSMSGIFLRGAGKVGEQAKSPLFIAPPTTHQATSEEAYVGPALRRFQRGDEVIFYFMVYNARRDKSQQCHLKVEMQAYRDGLEVHVAKPIEVTAQGPKKEDVACTGVLKFYSEIDAGTYALRFVVTDQLARGKQSQTTQWIDLEIL